MDKFQKNILALIEDLNYNYLNKKDQKKNGLRLFINTIKTGNILYAIKRIIKKKKIYSKSDIEANRMFEPIKIVNDNNIKIAIYTCITGKYDSVSEPYVLESNCDYYIYTNNSEICSNNWKVIDIPENIKKLQDNILINRYIKMHPYELFENNYDYAIYIDGNISIISNISSFCEKTSEKLGIALHKHYSKECIYDEMRTCQVVGKGNTEQIKLQEKRYKLDKFPTNYGMYECNVIVTNMNNKNGKKVMESWWEEFENSSSMRDQICLPYCLWKLGYKYEDIGIIGKNVFLNPKIRINKHI